MSVSTKSERRDDGMPGHRGKEAERVKIPVDFRERQKAAEITMRMLGSALGARSKTVSAWHTAGSCPAWAWPIMLAYVERAERSGEGAGMQLKHRHFIRKTQALQGGRG